MSKESPTPKRSSRWRKLRNACLALALGIVLSLLTGELVLRLFLFHPNLELWGLGASIRLPEKYCNGDLEDDYWKLRSGFQDPSLIVDAPNADPITGWTGSFITPGTYAHVNENAIHGRQVVILYGDSFAQCNTPPDECFQAILERSELAKQYVILNYGVGGYGLDQIYLLLKNSIDRFKDLDPIVIVGILVESDLERSVLSFRDWPKPHLEVVDGDLVQRHPVEMDTKKYLAEHPISIKSFLWRFFLFHPTHLMSRPRAQWRENERARAEKEALNRRILIEIDRELSSRHLKHFFLVFHAEQGALEPWSIFAWQERLIRDVSAEFSIPLVDTRPYLSFAADGRPVQVAQFYGHSGPLYGHHNAVGNLVCFEAVRQGILGDFGAPDMEHLAALKKRGLFDSGDSVRVPMDLLGRPATLIIHGSTERIHVTETSRPTRLILRGDALGPTHVEFELNGRSKRFTGRVHTMMDPDKGCADVELSFTVEVDGQVVLGHDVPPSKQALDLDIDLAGKDSLSLGVRGFGGGAGCDWVCIEDPRLE